ncbi:Ethanolamine-P-transferase GPI11/PIG-F, involved in glycosylphosphatidylinositol anchor biosynthesis [Phaffia rhodozyma]|uniref:Ethanolamine-P-transferase GPI11/PIG-F, involved in glycosylphosphatidylinositol anchor biosynthesis n=1 Tax=Phaffia rhodozyma TaxID=264483 RepID=A0A0F7SK22_PHARH|nr:Ethanolamine-P-transferase GPI11/PIG-F, involved in glycosylphosphatidylinositol anchor biosynthesis [Phaffia rhodozyma]
MPPLLNLKAPKKPVFPSRKKTTSATGTTAGDDTRDLPLPSLSAVFPLGKYLSLTAVHVLLLSFVLLALPRSEFPVEISSPAGPAGKRGTDRPEWHWVAALTADPGAFTGWVALGLVAVEAWWTGQIGDLWDQQEEEEANARKKLVVGGGGGQEKEEEEAALRRTIITTMISSVFIHLFIHLLGLRPFTSSVSPASRQIECYLLSLVLSSLTVWTPVALLGPPPVLGELFEGGKARWDWVRLFLNVKLKTPVERAMVYPVLGALLGAWLGVFPMALDWDRPFQAFPIPIVFGAILGFIAGHLSSLAVSCWEVVLKAGSDEFQAGLKTE